MTTLRTPTLHATANFLAIAFLILISVTSATALPTWSAILLAVGLASWAARVAFALARLRRVALFFGVTAIASSAVVITTTHMLSLAITLVCLYVISGDSAVSRVFSMYVAAFGIFLIALGSVITPVSISDLLTIFVGLILSLLIGYSRRQNQQLQRQSIVVAQHQAELSEREKRLAAAREVHDVLAHTLGGLLIQLEASDALLEAGEIPPARERLSQARDRAQAGLTEVRKTVSRLRSSNSDLPSAPSRELIPELAELIAAHRELGEILTYTQDGIAPHLESAEKQALIRALQEALSNARRHAPGELTTVACECTPEYIRLIVTNPTTAASSSAPGGYGLMGMRERFQALPHGGAVHAENRNGVFTLTVEARLQ